MEVSLEDAMDRAGAGKYQVYHGLLMWASLASSLQEMISYAFVLPAAACDLGLTEGVRGWVTSIPNIGIILTAPMWGRAADTWGRKPMLLGACAAAGAISAVAAFMPTLVSFAVVKMAGAFFLSAPTSLGYAYVGEMTPRKRRDFAVLMCNGFLTLSSVLSPLLAWGILSMDWHYQLGAIDLRPWRLLTIVYSSLMVFTAIWLLHADESPKFLLAKGKTEESLQVLKKIYVKNTGLSADSFGIKALKQEYKDRATKSKDDSVFSLLRPPHLKWFALTAFLMFGLYTLLNGIYLFATDTINKVLREPSGEPATLCRLINQPDNQTSSTCNDSIFQSTFLIMAVSTLVYAVLVVLASMSPVSKKTLLVAMYIVCGCATLLAGVLTNRIIAGAAMSAMQITALGIGPLTAYTVQLFPTSLRGTAVGGVLMFGRVGSVSGATLAGYLLPIACSPTFYGFAIFMINCAALSLLLPKNQTTPPSPTNNNNVPNGDTDQVK